MHCPLTLVISLGQLMAGVCWLFSLFWELCRFLLFEGEERRVQGETRRFRQILHLETAAVEPGGRKVLQSIVVVFWLSAEKDHSHQDNSHQDHSHQDHSHQDHNIRTTVIMLEIFSDLRSLLHYSHVSIDSWVFRLHYRSAYTVREHRGQAFHTVREHRE